MRACSLPSMIVHTRARFLLAMLPCLASSIVALSTKPIPSHRLSSQPIVPGLLDRVRHNDRAGEAARCALPFCVGNNSNSTILGHVLPQAANEFSKYPSCFTVTDQEVRLLDQTEWFESESGNIDNSDNIDNSWLVAKRSEALADILQRMREADSIPALRGWRDEAFSVRESFHEAPQLIVERAAAVLLGVPAYGVFVNGYTCEDSTSSNPTHLWIGRRSPTKQTWPGRLDSLAAGGLGAGMLPKQAMMNECIEEAGIDDAYLEQNLRAVSAVSYTGFNDDGWGLKRDVLFCFDLELPPDFCPTPVDGEMESFEKLSISEVVQLLAQPIVNEDDSDNVWKPNVGVVLIDFLVRHGMLDSDDPKFLELIDALRGAKCA